MKKKHIVVLTGAGISAESGISTFRDSDGLWEKHSVKDVATPEGFEENPKRVLDFYNQRRAQLNEVEPNQGHTLLAQLETEYNVSIITQNIDNLHERAGSTVVLHLHGELTKAQSTKNRHLIYDIGTNAIDIGDTCDYGSQLRPHIVWFGEPVPEMEHAQKIVQSADIFVVIGTSLNVYPAAGLVAYVGSNTPSYIIDPKQVEVPYNLSFTVIQKKASSGVVELIEILKKSHADESKNG